MARKSSLALVVFIAAALVTGVLVAFANTLIEEADLNPTGEVYEVNQTGDARLLISDPGAQEIWLVNPPTGVYTTYDAGAAARDARMRADGTIWFSDYAVGFGMIDPDLNELTIWDTSVVITRNLNLGGVAFDNSGQVWLTEWIATDKPRLQRFDPVSQSLCEFRIMENAITELGAYSYYLRFDGTYFWLLNWFKNDILRFDPAVPAVRSWDVGSISVEYQGFEIDSAGNLWWASEVDGAVAVLDPNTGMVTRYTLPVGSGPNMLALVGDKIWYTENVSATIGTLDPQAASGSPSPVAAVNRPVDAGDCYDLSSAASTTILPAPQVGSFSWTGAPAQVLFDSGGWQVYDLPDGSAGNTFLGLAYGADYLWATDEGRQKVVRLPDQTPADLQVSLAALSETLVEPGGSFDFTATVTNPSLVDGASISVITDTYGTPVCGTLALAPGEATDCTFSVVHTGNAGDSWIHTVHVTAVDEDGVDVSAVSNDLTVSLTDSPAVTLQVTKTTAFDTLEAPGGMFYYTATVTNPSTVDDATISVITDTFGVPVCDMLQLAPSASAVCTFNVDHTGVPGDFWTNTVYVTAADDDGADISAISNEVTVQLVAPSGFEIFLPIVIKQ